MIYEFIFNHKVYAIKREINFNISDAVNEEVVLFRDLDNAQSFFRSITHDQLASEDLLQIAKRLGVTNSGSAPQTTQAVFEKLCLKVFYGELVLVEIKPVPVIWFEKCCISTIMQINIVLASCKHLDKVIFGSRVFTALFSHTRGNALYSYLSTATNFYGINPSEISGREWEAFGKAIAAVPLVERKSSFKLAQYEVKNHIKDNKQDLRKFWEGIMNAFA